MDEKGEGIHHLLFKVRNINATIEKFANKGIAVLQRDFPGGVGGPAYMDTAATGGICIEVMEDLPSFDADETENAFYTPAVKTPEKHKTGIKQSPG